MSHRHPDLNRAIFDRPPDSLGEDESHNGHLVLAMGVMEAIEIAQASAVAGDRLLAEAQRSGETWEAAHPILYCYRHALELYLRAWVQPEKRNHYLNVLWSALHNRILEDHIAWLGNRVLEFHHVDQRSAAFQYHDAHPQGIEPELWVDFHKFARRAKWMFKAVETIWRRMMSDDPHFARYP